MKSILIGSYVLLSIGVAWCAIRWISNHVKANSVPSAFGLEYLPGAIPFLAALLSFLGTPVLICMVGRRVTPESGIRLFSIPILAIAFVSYCVLLFMAASFFAWYRQAI